jgi:hypothetical protein
MDAQLPNNNVPEELKASDPNQQLSSTDLDSVVGGGTKPAADPPKQPYLKVEMENVIISG